MLATEFSKKIIRIYSENVLQENTIIRLALNGESFFFLLIKAHFSYWAYSIQARILSMGMKLVQSWLAHIGPINFAHMPYHITGEFLCV